MTGLPPIAYDYPYQGKLTVKRVNPEQMHLVCPLPKQPRSLIVGCAHLQQNACEVIVLDDAGLKALGWNVDIVLRHEIAHCNGWPADHPGAETV